MSVSRSWTWIDESKASPADDDGEGEPSAEQIAAEAKINALMARWNELQTEIENEGFLQQSMHDDPGRDVLEFDTDEERIQHEAQVRVRDELREAEIEKIEELLADLNARPMRPYEHWNEEESMMEYLETRYDNDY